MQKSNGMGTSICVSKECDSKHSDLGHMAGVGACQVNQRIQRRNKSELIMCKCKKFKAAK